MNSINCWDLNIANCTQIQLEYPQCISIQEEIRLLLVLSNIAFLIPPLVIILVRKYTKEEFDESDLAYCLSMLLVTICSSLYHLCLVFSSDPTLFDNSCDSYCAFSFIPMEVSDMMAAFLSVHTTACSRWSPTTKFEQFYLKAVYICIPFISLALYDEDDNYIAALVVIAAFDLIIRLYFNQIKLIQSNFCLDFRCTSGDGIRLGSEITFKRYLVGVFFMAVFFIIAMLSKYGDLWYYSEAHPAWHVSIALASMSFVLILAKSVVKEKKKVAYDELVNLDTEMVYSIEKIEFVKK